MTTTTSAGIYICSTVTVRFLFIITGLLRIGAGSEESLNVLSQHLLSLLRLEPWRNGHVFSSSSRKTNVSSNIHLVMHFGRSSWAFYELMWLSRKSRNLTKANLKFSQVENILRFPWIYKYLLILSCSYFKNLSKQMLRVFLGRFSTHKRVLLLLKVLNVWYTFLFKSR